MKVLMVCLGNICRSPIAEGVLQKKAKDAGLNWVVDSAATLSYHIGEAPHHLSQRISKKHGVDISKQKARLLIKEDFEAFDKIYAMSNDVVLLMKEIGAEKFNSEKVDLLLNEINPGKNEDLLDPWFGPESSFTIVYNLVNEACDKIIEKHK